MVNDLVVVPGFGAQKLFRGTRPSSRSFRNSLNSIQIFRCDRRHSATSVVL